MVKVIYSNNKTEQRNLVSFESVGELVFTIKTREIFKEKKIGSSELKVKYNPSEQIVFYIERLKNKETWTLVNKKDITITDDDTKWAAEHFDGSDYSGEEGLMKLVIRLHDDDYFIPIIDPHNKTKTQTWMINEEY